MNILPMRYFLSVVKNGGISSAARELYITQQTLSAHIAALERELDCCLFVRKPFFRLTGEGEVFRDYCEKMVSLDAGLHEEFALLKKEPVGVLRIGISQTRSRLLMPAATKKWLSEYPKVTLTIRERTNEQLISELLSGELDMMIGNVHDELPELSVCPIYEEKLLLLVPENFRQLIPESGPSHDLAELQKLPFVMHTDRDILGRYARELFSEKSLNPRAVVISDNSETCMDMCTSGIGAYICPDLFLKRAGNGRGVHAFPLDCRYTISAAWRKDLYSTRLVREFSDLLRAIMDA